MRLSRVKIIEIMKSLKFSKFDFHCFDFEIKDSPETLNFVTPLMYARGLYLSKQILLFLFYFSCNMSQVRISTKGLCFQESKRVEKVRLSNSCFRRRNLLLSNSNKVSPSKTRQNVSKLKNPISVILLRKYEKIQF